MTFPTFLTLLIFLVTLLPSRGDLLPLLSDINVLIVTDTHSWVAGHGTHESNMNADYGDVLSFYERLKAICASQQKELFFVMNGDFMDGTGLTTNPPQDLTPLLEKMPWDAVTLGNHELYDNSTIDFISKKGGFVDFWDGKYITSNTVHSGTNSSIGVRYKFLDASYSSSRILTFGFLYNMQYPCPAAEVEKVQNVVNSPWFTNVLKGIDGDFDAILVLAHMDAKDPLVFTILDRIREICGQTIPVQFVTGHSHRRKFYTLDPFSTSFEAGRYLDTLGFTSFSLSPSNLATTTTSSTSNIGPHQEEAGSFNHMYIDTSIDNFKDVLGVEELQTKAGKELSSLIEQTRQSLGLLEVIGCSPQSYSFHSGLNEDNSLWGVFSKQVVPSQLLLQAGGNQDIHRVYIQGSGAFRYNLFEGKISIDDIIAVNPFNDTVFLVDAQIQGSEFLKAFGYHDLGKESHYHNMFQSLPQYVVSGTIEKDLVYEVYTADYDLRHVVEQLSQATDRKMFATPFGNLTTGILWTQYIEQEWTCDKDASRKEKFMVLSETDKVDAVFNFGSQGMILSLTAFTFMFVLIRSYQHHSGLRPKFDSLEGESLLSEKDELYISHGEPLL
jgi:2',3'-cyclic-nucleotide 2'-phosphodiesterase (5'-nucleotidase family)